MAWRCKKKTKKQNKKKQKQQQQQQQQQLNNGVFVAYRCFLFSEDLAIVHTRLTFLNAVGILECCPVLATGEILTSSPGGVPGDVAREIPVIVCYSMLLSTRCCMNVLNLWGGNGAP